MLRSMRDGSRWIMWIVIVGVGGVFALYLGGSAGGGGNTGPEVVVRVGDRSYDVRDVYRVRRNQEAEYRRVLGDGFDPQAASAMLDQNAAATLLRTGLLAMEADSMGLEVSNDEVRGYLRRIAGAAEGERIDEELVTNYAQQNYGTLRHFERALRDDLLAQKALRAIGASVSVSDAEARDALDFQREEVEIAFVRIDAVTPPEGPSQADIDRVLAEDAEVIREEYERRRSEFDRPERVHARHILFRASEDEGEEALAKGLAAAEAARARLEQGAAFEDLAMELSEDPGSKDQGGDLGFFPRGRMVEAFDEAAFSAEPGALVGPVHSTFGYHLIRVEEREEAHIVPFEEAQARLARERAAREAGRGAARESAEELSAAIEDGASLVEAARELGRTIERPDPLRRRADGYIAGLGANPEVMNAAFALTEERPSDPRVHETERGVVLIELMSRSGPSEEEAAVLLPELRAQLESARREAIETAWLESLRDDLTRKGELVYNLDSLTN